MTVRFFRRKRGRQLFWNAELIILDKVLRQAPQDTREIIQNQLEQVCKVQRICQNIEVSMYFSMKRGANLDFLVKLKTKAIEYKLATVRFRESASEEVTICSVWIVNGHVFMLEYSRPMPRLRKADIQIESIEIHPEPCDPPNATT